MKMDFHVHLEEGPYTVKWLERTAKTLSSFGAPADLEKGSKAFMRWQTKQLQKRVDQGCFSSFWLDLYLEKAKQLGLKKVGIVDHLYRFKETRSYFEKNMILDPIHPIGRAQSAWLNHVMTENMVDFVEAIEKEKEKWRLQGIELKLGIEADYFEGCETELTELLGEYAWDFVIGSVHFVDGWGFDNPQTADVFLKYDLKELYNRFYIIVENAIRSELFDFVAHLDNLKVFNYQVQDISFNQVWHEKIANALVETNTATEVNAGLYYRYPVKEMCPGPSFLTTLVERGVEFTLSSDSHYPDDLGNYTADNKEMLKKLGVKSLVSFDQRAKKSHLI
ncbi:MULTISPECIES: histidinol phosphate phosphatase domain-containing protein [Planococcus]|uniref:Histidinol-phosphatase n=1 Tax=Planococcus faecalis TaxID=1598147 RepID=A0ABM6IVZ2_9BACL|nr:MULTISPECIES: histidinol phosphate phosphatase domain-containing protein [Planococcus]AQU80752.1 histidinol-phosphatase [Planococcus faecalis]MDJ0331968.1 histidinol phosphate phosphatase domain-containing protein [Planococcus sp. S3-L1]OHX55743.1 histidinol-phosphatase [Planococcus faecalis]